VDAVEPDYQPYLAGPFRWRLGLRPLSLEDWIEIGPDYDEAMALKRRVLAEHPHTVLAWLPGIETEAAEVLDALVAHLCERWPAWFTADADTVVNRRTGERWRRDELHPLDLAGRLVPEDLVLMVERHGGLVFAGGSVCFPNRWDLASKLGQSLRQVHAPVARLNEQLAAPIDAFFERLRPERSYWRLGWGVLDTDERYQPVDGTAPPSPRLPEPGDPTAADRLFLRVERETLRRMPRTRCVLFTIRTYVRPVRHLAGRPDDAARLAAALAALPPDVADYKQVRHLRPVAERALEELAKT
jgi:hypothetical protein